MEYFSGRRLDAPALEEKFAAIPHFDKSLAEKCGAEK
jgi:hypothetical protein